MSDIQDDDNNSGNSKARAVLRRIDEEIAAYNRGVNKRRLIEIDAVLKHRREIKARATERARATLTPEELDILGIPALDSKSIL